MLVRGFLPLYLTLCLVTMKLHTRSIPALSAIVGIIIGVGVTAAAGSTLYYTFESQTDPFKSSSALDVRNLSVVKDEDLLRITATLRNNGQTRIDHITIDKILVSNIEISQDSSSIVTLDVNGVNQTHNTHYTYMVEGLTSLSSEVSIPYGQSKALILELKSTSAATSDIENNVKVSDRLTMTLRIEAGGDTFITDAFSARVKPG